LGFDDLVFFADILTTYTWDYENRLTGITYPTGHILTNLYSADGIRQGYSDSVTGVTTLTYDPVTLNLHRRDVSISPATDRFTTPPQMYAMPFLTASSANGTEMHLPDLSGNNSGIFNGSSVTAEYEYTTFGIPTFYTDSYFQPLQYGFGAGYYADPSSGLIYIKARWYDPLTAAWISKDPLGFPGGNYNSLYRFVGNNPVMRVDPSGLWSVDSGCNAEQTSQINAAMAALTAKAQAIDNCLNTCGCQSGGDCIGDGTAPGSDITFYCYSDFNLACWPYGNEQGCSIDFGANIGLCPIAFASSRCAPLFCLIAHELLHSCGVIGHPKPCFNCINAGFPSCSTYTNM
jgi:RHS repeat-associated protein